MELLLTAEAGATRLEIVVADITTLDVNAIVNAATGKAIADAKSVSVTFDYAIGQPVPIPEATRVLLETARR